jgi:hypothetical protein
VDGSFIRSHLAVFFMALGFAAASVTGSGFAQAPPPRPVIECPHSNAHVWDPDQCDAFDFGNNNGHGGGACRGILCGIPGVGGLLGSIL